MRSAASGRCCAISLSPCRNAAIASPAELRRIGILAGLCIGSPRVHAAITRTVGVTPLWGILDWNSPPDALHCSVAVRPHSPPAAAHIHIGASPVGELSI